MTYLIGYFVVGLVVGALMAYYAPDSGEVAFWAIPFWPVIGILAAGWMLHEKGEERQQRIAAARKQREREEREQARLLREAGLD